MNDPADFDERKLERLRSRTAGIEPAPGFDDWIVGRVERSSRVSSVDASWRAGRWALCAAAVAAAASIVVASETGSLVDERVIAAFGLEEVEE